jgi:allantoinase
MADQIFCGDIVLPTHVVAGGYLLVADGKIVHVGEGEPPAGERHGGAGFLVLPGAIDAQVHSRSQRDQEDFIWSTRSAAAGGVTTIVDMPYDDGDLIATGERLTRKAETAAVQARVDFALYATIHPKDGPERAAELAAAGAAGFKFSTFGTHPERFPRVPLDRLYAYFAAIAKLDLIAGIHNENDEMVRSFIADVEAGGLTDYRAHGLSRPPVTEAVAMAEVYELGAATGCAVHVVHCSIGRGYDLAASYRQQGFASTVEACIHYLTLNEEDDVRRLVGKAKINPPIRSKVEVERLWQHLAAGNVTIVSTDHVSWSENLKSDPNMLKNSSGAPSLEVLYPLLLKGLEDHDLPLTHAARLLAHNPASLFRLDDQKGALVVGRDADIALARRDPYRYDAGASGHNVVSWSAYEGMMLPWRIVETFVRGKNVFDGRNVGEPGFGRFVRPSATRSLKVV